MTMALPRRCSHALVLGIALGMLLLVLASAHPGHGQSQGGPRAVTVSLQVNSITEIDSAKETFRADFYMTLSWHDPALVNADPQNVDWSRIRKPVIELINSQDAEPLGQEVLRLESPGVARCENRYAGTFSSRMDLEDFPFDEQFLSILVESQNETADQMVFFFRPNQGVRVDVRGKTVPIRMGSVFGSELYLPEWKVTTANVREATYHYYGDHPYSRFQLDLKIARRVGYYIWKIMSVLVMLVVLSWAVFLIDPADIGNRMAVSITLFLAAVAFAFVTSGLIPRISYLTLLDIYILGCYVLLFLAPVESLLVYRLRNGSRARRIDRLALWGFPAAFLLLQLLVWVRS